MESFNILAIMIASIAAMGVGAFWYSPLLFEKAWRAHSELKGGENKQSPIFIYGGAFFLIIVGAAVFHLFLGADPDLGFAIGVGFAAGLAWAAGSLWISYLFEERSLTLGFINGGFLITQYVVFGLTFGLM